MGQRRRLLPGEIECAEPSFLAYLRLMSAKGSVIQQAILREFLRDVQDDSLRVVGFTTPTIRFFHDAATEIQAIFHVARKQLGG